MQTIILGMNCKLYAHVILTVTDHATFVRDIYRYIANVYRPQHFICSNVVLKNTNGIAALKLSFEDAGDRSLK